MNVLGLDLSLTGTGMALVGTYKTDPWKTHRITTSNDIPVYERWETIRRVISEWIPDVDLVVLEGLSYNTTLNNAQGTPELSGVIRHYLWCASVKQMVVPPATLKKFITGKGNADKSVILKEVLKRWGFDTDDHNEADAFGLAKLGQALLVEPVDLPQWQQEIVAQLKAGPKPKKSKRVRAAGRTL